MPKIKILDLLVYKYVQGANLLNLLIIFLTKEMQVSVCNHLINRQFINKISYNQIHNILAAIVDTSDTILFYHYQL